MAIRNNTSVNLDIQLQSVGADLGGGLVTNRFFGWRGNNDFILQTGNDVNTTYTFTSNPTDISLDSVVLGSCYKENTHDGVGAITFGNTQTSSGGLPSVLSLGTTGQVLRVNATQDAPEWASLPPSIQWQVFDGPTTGEINTGYILTGGLGSVVIGFPTPTAVGDIFAVYSNMVSATATWMLAGNDVNTVQYGLTLMNADGSISNTQQGDGIWLVCVDIGAVISWLAITSVGILAVNNP